MIKIPKSLSTLCFLAAMACAPNNSGTAPTPPNGNKGNPGFRESTVCYPGHGERRCFAVTPIAELPEQQHLYQYPDPETDRTFPGNASPAQYRQPDRVLPLKNVSPQVSLSSHFALGELMPVSRNRGYYAIFSPEVVERLESLRDQINLPMRITSGFRSPGHNGSTPGAARWSRHTYGDGVDFAVEGMSYKELAAKCLANGAGFYQLYTDHIHCDWRSLDLDSGFFPIEVTPLPPSLKPEATWNLSGYLMEIRPLVLAAVVDQEDEGELTYEWSVQGPNGYAESSEGTEIKLPQVSGRYMITVLVGGSSVIQQEISIP